MSEPFLITGLPRSRTAWMAAAATIAGWSECSHEPSLDMDDFDDLEQFFARGAHAYCGASDCQLGFRLPRILSEIRPRTLIVARNKQAVHHSLAKAGLKVTSFCDDLIPILKSCFAHPLVKVVEYNRLTDSAAVVECLRHLMPLVPIDKDRIEALQAVKIEADTRATAMKMAPRLNKEQVHVEAR